MQKPELSEEDKQRVKDYLDNNPLHSRERKPFRVGILLMVLVGFVSILSLLSIILAKYYYYA